jgi:hypothetical protein
VEHRLFAFDLDGTLLGAGNTVSDRTRQALAAVRDLGATTVLASGRPPQLMWSVVEQCAGSVTHLVCDNGTGVLDAATGTTLHRITFDATVARALMRRLRADHPSLGFGLLTEAGFAYEPGFRNIVPVPPPGEPVPDASVVPGERVQKLIVFHPAIPTVELMGLLAAEVGEGLAVAHAGIEAADIGPAGVSKATGLQWLCDHLGLVAAEAVAFGDNLNDHEMLRWAGHGVAMANADESTRGLADEVAGHHLDDGVARVLERYLAGDPR